MSMARTLTFTSAVWILHGCGGLAPIDLPGAGRYELDLADFDSHPIARDLGLKPGKNEITDAFWAEFSFRMQPGRALR